MFSFWLFLLINFCLLLVSFFYFTLIFYSQYFLHPWRYFPGGIFSSSHNHNIPFLLLANFSCRLSISFLYFFLSFFLTFLLLFYCFISLFLTLVLFLCFWRLFSFFVPYFLYFSFPVVYLVPVNLESPIHKMTRERLQKYIM